jgi:serine/threonine-protein kinase
MEHVAGETLAARLLKGPMPPEQALVAATEIADTLAAAHRQGVIHRDLKPGNVMLTKAGAKLLDFGLAKLAGHGAEPAVAQLASAATRSAPLTAEGTIVGTLQYMAPEQVEGKPADARTDLWALGSILYEMLTGKRAFEGTSAASLITAIMSTEPPALATLQPLTPPALDRLVKKCLAKQPDDRWDSAHDVADELRWLRETSGPALTTPVQLRRSPWRTVAAAVVLAAAGAVVGAGGLWLLRPTPAASASIIRTSLDVRPAERFDTDLRWTALAWTPDGKALVFVGTSRGARQLYVRRLDGADARPLPHTEGAASATLSPDGQFVAFWAGGAIRKVPLAGGPAMTLAAGIVEPPIGLAWDGRGRLFFGHGSGPQNGIREVMPDGTVRAVTTIADVDVRDGLPSPLPDGDTLLVTVRKRWQSWGDEQVDAVNVASGARKLLVKDATDARYVPTGHLLFLRRGVLFAVPFDPARLEVTGEESPLLESVAQVLAGVVSGSGTGAGQFAVSPAGTLAWAHRPVDAYPDRRLVTVDRRGRVTPLMCPPRSFGGALRLAPDGRRLAAVIRNLNEVGLWSYDLERGGLTLIAGAAEVWWPLWSRDGRSLYYGRMADGRTWMAVQAAESGSEPRTFLAPTALPSSLTPDGKTMAIVRHRDIFAVTLQDGHPVEAPLVVTAHQESWPEFSPDGRWLAYASDYSGRWEVYVRPHPGSGPSQVVSLDGGDAPVWNPNGRELFFVSLPDAAGKRAMMSVQMQAGVPQGRPQQLFQFDPRALYIGGGWLRTHDVAADGERFYTSQELPAEPPPVVTHINLVQNWFEELKAKVPAGGAR